MNWWIFDTFITADLLIILICIFGALFIGQKFLLFGKKFFLLFVLLTIVHYLLTPYNALNGADSVKYYHHAEELNYFVLGQRGLLVESVTWLFIHYLNLSFLGCNFVFSFIGLLGWYFLLLILIDIYNRRWSRWFIVLLLPELHFWTCFLGKDSLVFFSICIIVYTWYFHKSFLNYAIPCIIIGYIRAPVILVILSALGVGILFQSRTHFLKKILIVGFFLIVFAMFLPMAIQQVRMEEFDVENVEDYIARNEQYHRDERFGSSIDMRNQSIFVKMFAYQFRPLFYDAGGFLQLEASFENAWWFLLFLLICLRFRMKYILWFPFLAYMSLWASQSLGLNNLGIAMRQKMMFFPFFITLFFQTLYDAKVKKYRHRIRK